ncbi:MAG: efflux RND transporter periplasmic adaptor subunit [Paludibacteraceae bacterium]|nr:efflux RND transporter periplasmic adaptor subunit [Paludibacteraceae bacterium]
MNPYTRQLRFIREQIRFVLFCLICVLPSCIVVVKERGQRSEQPVRCDVMTVQPVASLSTYTYMATIQAEAQIPLSMPYGGTITEVCVQPNSKVRQGDVLLRVDDTSARQALTSARAALTQAQDAMRRTQPLHEKGLITDIQMVDLQTKLDQAQAACVAAERQVRQSVLTAPQNGLVTFDALHVGQHLTPEVPVMTLLNLSGFTAVVHVPETEIAALHLGDSATLAIPAMQTDGLHAQLSRIGVQANSLTHTYPVEAYICNPPAGVLPGMVGALTVLRPERSAIIIPQRCVTMLPDGPAVWGLTADNLAERRPVTLGAYQADGVQVLSGLNSGDRLVTAGYQNLYHHAPVEPTDR